MNAQSRRRSSREEITHLVQWGPLKVSHSDNNEGLIPRNTSVPTRNACTSTGPPYRNERMPERYTRTANEEVLTNTATARARMTAHQRDRNLVISERMRRRSSAELAYFGARSSAVAEIEPAQRIGSDRGARSLAADVILRAYFVSRPVSSRRPNLRPDVHPAFILAILRPRDVAYGGAL